MVSKKPTAKISLPNQKQNSKRRNGRPKRTRRGKNQPNKPSGVVGTGVVVVRDIPAFGLRTQRRMKFHEHVTFTGSASLAAAYVYSANGVYDPNVTGTGLQPIFFDCMMTLYNHYTVRRSRIKVSAQNLGTVTTHVAVSVSGSSSVTTDDSQLVANGNLVYALILPTGVAESVALLRHSAQAGQFQGIDDVMDDPNMRGDAASNPTEQLYYHVSIWNPVNATVPSILLDVEIDYDVVFHEPRKAALSLVEMVELQRVARLENIARKTLAAAKATENKTPERTLGRVG